MLVETIRCLEDNFSYILIDQNKNACVIDPSESEPIINFVEKNNFGYWIFFNSLISNFSKLSTKNKKT